MADEKAMQPRNIFELINQNVVDISQDVVQLYNRVDAVDKKITAIYNALYPPAEKAPNADGAIEEVSETNNNS